MKDCVFCMIDAGEIPSPKVYEDEDFFVIRDIEPKAKEHFLVIPHEHYKYLAELDEERAKTLSRIIAKIPAVAEKLGLTSGYRLVINQGDDAGQTVPHLHIHLLGGQYMDFPHF